MQIEFSNGSLFVDGKDVEFLIFENNEMIEFPIETAIRPQISSFALLKYVLRCMRGGHRTKENMDRVVLTIHTFLSETLGGTRTHAVETRERPKIKRPEPKYYGWEDADPLGDNGGGGWQVEGGEEAYHAAMAAYKIEINTPYSEASLSDLYEGASLELAIAQYKDAIATSCTPKEAFRFTVWSIERMHRKIGVNEDEDVVLPSYEDTVNEILKNGPDPKTRLFTPDEMAIAIEFFTQKQIPVEDVVSWGQGIDPYWNGED